MSPEATSELIWHFAGYLHLTEDYAASRLKYDYISYHNKPLDYRPDAVEATKVSASLPELQSHAIRVSYTSNASSSGQADSLDVAKAEVEAPVVKAYGIYDIAHAKADVQLQPIHSTDDIHHTVGSGQFLQGETTTPGTGTGSEAPVYTIDYNTDALGGTIANLTSIHVLSDRDFYSDGGDDYAGLHHVSTGNAVPDMMEMASEYAPDFNVQAGQVREFWAEEMVRHDEAIASGESTGQVLALGRYVNGELQEPGSSAVEPVQAPERPDRADAGTDVGNVAELGGNTSQNVGIIADLNEAPSTLVVMGNYYHTNLITQTNILQDHDQAFTAGSGAGDITINTGGNQTDNMAILAAHEIVTQAVAARPVTGDLSVNVDFFDGDFFDIKALNQRNYIDDGDVTTQTQYESYAEVSTGDNTQLSYARFADWGKHYDIIIVLGDYHSANIISQTNIVLDNDVLGIGSGSGVAGAGHSYADDEINQSAYSGQNQLLNEAAITKYGESTFAGIDGNLAELIAALGNKETLDAASWSSFHGAASGHLNVLFVTGDYYDLNIISQVNVIADADLAIQIGSDGSLQWLSTGGNSAINKAEIIDAGGVYNQYLGGSQYEDSMLVQTNIVSASADVTQTNSNALVPEVIAFLDQAQDATPDADTWTTNTYNNHDSFGNVLS
jgi:hypothetical protein